MFLGSEQRLKQVQGRVPWLFLALGLLSLTLVARLFYLQVLRHNFYELLARENKIVYEQILGDRGMILDRWGTTLVDNRPAYNIYLLPDSFKASKRQVEKKQRAERTVTRLAKLLSMDPAEIWKVVEDAKGRARFKPVLLKTDITWDELSRIEEASLRSSGVFVRTEPIREYPYGATGAHIMGYIHEVSPTELDRLRREFPDHGYHQGALVGKYGVELEAEAYLRGRDGFREQIVNAFGGEVDASVLQELGFEPENQPSSPGDNIVLTLDWELQQYAEEVFSESAGAMVAMDPYTGEILAMVSHPAFDPSPFARGIKPEEYSALMQAPGAPLYSKALQGQYPPGSTYKAFVAIAGLEEKVITSNFEPVCHGRLRYGRRWFGCWRTGGHGETDLHKALRESCDVFFYKVGDAVGIDKIAYYSRLFGFGQLTGIDLSGETAGLIPTTSWKQRVRGEPWQGGETLPCAIGQGFNLVTPLQMARAVSAIANGGTLVQPYVISRAINTAGQTIHDFAATKKRTILPINPDSIRQVQEGLIAVVNEPGGTGRVARLPKTLVAGKTGTAQVVRLEHTEQFKNDDEIPREFRDHAWFFAYAPADAPRIVVSTLVEHGGHGGAAAAPLAGKVIYKFEELRKKRETALLEAQEPEDPVKYAGRSAPQ